MSSALFMVFLCTNPPKYYSSLLRRDPHGRKGIEVQAGNGSLLWFQIIPSFLIPGPALGINFQVLFTTQNSTDFQSI